MWEAAHLWEVSLGPLPFPQMPDWASSAHQVGPWPGTASRAGDPSATRHLGGHHHQLPGHAAVFPLQCFQLGA